MISNPLCLITSKLPKEKGNPPTAECDDPAHDKLSYCCPVWIRTRLNHSLKIPLWIHPRCTLVSHLRDSDPPSTPGSQQERWLPLELLHGPAANRRKLLPEMKIRNHTSRPD